MNRWLVPFALFLSLGLGGCLTPAVQNKGPGEITQGPSRPVPVAPYVEDTTDHVAQVPPDTATAKALILADTMKGARQDSLQMSAAPLDTAKVEVAQVPKETLATSAPKTIPGFRVQVFASTSQVNAEKTLAEVRMKLGEKAYLEFNPPLYKVRVGNFLTENEADSLKARAVDAGYKAAFVVETNIEL